MALKYCAISFSEVCFLFVNDDADEDDRDATTTSLKWNVNSQIVIRSEINQHDEW